MNDNFLAFYLHIFSGLRNAVLSGLGFDLTQSNEFFICYPDLECLGIPFLNCLFRFSKFEIIFLGNEYENKIGLEQFCFFFVRNIPCFVSLTHYIKIDMSHHFMGNRWGNSGNSVRLYFFGAPKSLQMVIAAIKLKDAYSVEGKL